MHAGFQVTPEGTVSVKTWCRPQGLQPINFNLNLAYTITALRPRTPHSGDTRGDPTQELSLIGGEISFETQTRFAALS